MISLLLKAAFLAFLFGSSDAQTQSTTRTSTTLPPTTTMTNPPTTTTGSTTTASTTIASTTTVTASTSTADTTTTASTTTGSTSSTTMGSTTSSGSTTMGSTTSGSTTMSTSSGSTTMGSTTMGSTTMGSTTTAGSTTSGAANPTTTPWPNPTVSPNPTACSLSTQPPNAASLGILAEFQFNLNFDGYDCQGMLQSFSTLWNLPHGISLISTRRGSVVAEFFINDNGSGEASDRFVELSSLLSIPGSVEANQAAALGIPVISTRTLAPQNDSGGGPPIGLIVAGAIGGIVLITLIIFGIVMLVKRRSNSQNERYTPLMTMNSSVSDTSSHNIGAPYGFQHEHGESGAAGNLVSREEFAQKQAGAAAPAAAAGGAAGGVRHFKLIADIRDVGQGVLTGSKVGSAVEILEKDFTDSDWIWGTIDGKSGWVPKNHLNL